MAASTVTERTSVVLVSSVGTKIYLSSVGYPGHIVTIKDYTGVASQGNPIVVSTTQNVFFQDGSISTLLFNPFSFLTVSSKTPTIWQILNNTAFQTTLSNSFVDTLTVSNSFLNLVSSTQEFVSTSVTGNINVTNTLELLGNVDIFGDIVVNGVVDFFSTLDVKEQIYFSSGLTVNGDVALNSTLFVRDEMTVGGDTILSGDVEVGGDLFISSSLRVDRTLVPKFLSVQTITMSSVNIAGDVEVVGNLDTKNLFVGSSFVTLGSIQIDSNVFIEGSVQIDGDTTIQGFVSTNSLRSLSSGLVTLEASAYSVDVAGILSTASSLFVRRSLLVDETTQVNTVDVTGSVCTNSLVVGGNAEISSILASGNVSISGTMMLFSSFTTGYLEITNASQSTSVGGSLYAQNITTNYPISTITGGLAVQTNVVVDDKLTVKGASYLESATGLSTLYVAGNTSTKSLFIGGDLLIDKDFSIQGTATVGALAAPIEVILSTLTLSNTLVVTDTGNIPILIGATSLQNIPSSITQEGYGSENAGFLLASTINIRDTFQDFNEYADSKFISSLRASTITGIQLLSNFVVGDPLFEIPFTTLVGARIFCGSNTNGSNLFLVSPEYKVFSALPVQFSSIAYGIGTYNTTWIAVGEASNATSSIQISEDGAKTWETITSGGFDLNVQNLHVGRDVKYFPTVGLWIAVGGAGATRASIQYSGDGKNWSNATGGFPNGTIGGRRVFKGILFNGILAGGNAGAGQFGIYYSFDGITWTQATAPSYFDGFDCYDIAEDENFGGIAWAVGSNDFNSPTIFSASATNPTTNWNNSVSSSLPGNLSTLHTFATNNLWNIIGGAPLSGDANNSLFYRLYFNSSWNPSINNSGFSFDVHRVKYDQNLTTPTFVAVGSNSDSYNVRLSLIPQGYPASWQAYNRGGTPYSFPSAVYDYSYGTVSIIDTVSPFFVANTESRFASGFSTALMYGSSIQASSIQVGNLNGDASQITEITKFGRFMGVSSIQVDTLQWLPQFIERFVFDISGNPPATLPMSIYPCSIFSTVTTNTFMSLPSFSTVNAYIWLAAGLDTLERGNIQSSSNSSDWTRSDNATFNVKGNAIVGNSNPFQPFYVATGVDTRTDHTILWSSDGKTWNPIQSGGFSVEDEDGRKAGNTVVSINFFSREFLVGGNGPALLTTSDGINYTEISNPLFGSGIRKLKNNSSQFLALTNENNLLYSQDAGLTWYSSIDSVTSQPLPEISAFGFGYFSFFGITQFTWLAITPDGKFYYFLQGSFSGFAAIWVAMGPSVTPLLNVTDLLWVIGPPVAELPGNWIALESNAYKKSTGDIVNDIWTTGSVGAGTTALTSIYLKEDSQAGPPRLFIGAQAQESINTLWQSTDAGTSWTSINSGGFSSVTNAFGTGYAVAISSPYVLIGGTGTFGSQLPMQPQILRGLNLSSPPSPNPVASTLLTKANASNVFDTAVYGIGIASTNAQVYPFVAVGDGVVPQKTIARSSNLAEWIPAVTGGFTTGRAVTYYYNSTIERSIWVAVGTAVASTANIQYSSDGANWFPTNNSGGGLGLGGYGIALISSLERLVAVGEAFSNASATQPNRTIVYSGNGLNWSNAGNGQGFQEICYGIASGHKSGTNIGAAGEYVLAVGRTPSGNNEGSIQMSSNGVNWANILVGGFDVAGYGIAYGNPNGQPLWVAVGQMTGTGGPGTGIGTIQYSSDGELWNVATGGFDYGGYGVAYDTVSSIFVATGASGVNTTTVLYSQDGNIWNSMQSGGFSNEEFFGTAEGLFAQDVQLLEVQPFVEFPFLTIYSRATAQESYTMPTIRFQSTNIVLNEAMTVSSGRILINTYNPVGNNTVTVEGNIETSSFIYKGTDPNYRTITISSLIVSSLQMTGQFTGQFAGASLETPSWGFGISTLANTITFTQGSGGGGMIVIGGGGSFLTNINDTLYLQNPDIGSQGGVGINTTTITTQQITIQGTFACSTLSAAILKQDTVDISIPNYTPFESPFLTITTDINLQSLSNTNVIYSEISSLTFNNILTINQSSQRVGYFTSNPLFDFDARRAGWTSTLTTHRVRTETLFFTLQSF